MLWRETTLYTKDEQAILDMTEEVTLIQNHLSEATYDNTRKLFNEKYIAEIHCRNYYYDYHN